MQPSPSADTAGPVAPSLRCFIPTAYGLTGASRLAAPYDLSALAEHCPASPNLSARSASLIPGGYANYMQADEPLDRVRAAFGPDSFARLQALKSRYDPDNVLHRNQNIPPAT
jgi:hypothetical protein